MKQIYFIGGSPCSGKSTVTEMLTQKFDFEYFKIDDYLEVYTQKGAADCKPICLKCQSQTAEENWMRDPRVQFADEWLFYDEIFEYVMADLKALETDKIIIAEGAAFKPNLMKLLHVDSANYICMVPSREFQIEKYKQRDWIHYVIGECRDTEQAFYNWMERDILFAQEVKDQCDQLGYRCLITDGTRTIEAIENDVIEHFQLA